MNSTSMIMLTFGAMETTTSLGYVIGAVVAFLIFCYLVYSLFKADKF